MANSQNELNKGEVQSTKLNQFPVPGQNDTEFSAEEAAEAFEQQSAAGRSAQQEQ
ncbi:hypothetical protein [Paenibacillus xanthanilyticus]|uniref:YfhD family protein n=1 Tax=Paenibacillus xanthanilyticus TaxID=1783531 RepID=A0ABV8K4X1_9BACL